MEVKKPQEAQKAKAFWKKKTAKDAEEKYYDPTRENKILGETRQDWHFGKNLEDPVVTLDKCLKCIQNSCLKFLAQVLRGESVLRWPMLASSEVCGKSRSGRAFGPSVCLRTASMEWNVPGKYGPHGERALFLPDSEGADGAGQ